MLESLAEIVLHPAFKMLHTVVFKLGIAGLSKLITGEPRSYLGSLDYFVDSHVHLIDRTKLSYNVS